MLRDIKATSAVKRGFFIRLQKMQAEYDVLVALQGLSVNDHIASTHTINSCHGKPAAASQTRFKGCDRRGILRIVHSHTPASAGGLSARRNTTMFNFPSFELIEDEYVPRPQQPRLAQRSESASTIHTYYERRRLSPAGGSKKRRSEANVLDLRAKRLEYFCHQFSSRILLPSRSITKVQLSVLLD